MSKPTYFEIGALLEAQWTGIGSVVAAITKLALADEEVNWRFIYESFELPRALIERIIYERSGATARSFINERVWDQKLIQYSDAASSKCVFTNIKPTRGLFAKEAMVIYDLSPLLTPQFHSTDNINHFGYRFRADIESSDHFFPISLSTRDDLETYFGVARTASTVIALGVDIDLADLSLAQEVARHYQVEPYVVVLGTLEPRKNGALILDYISRNPGFAHRFRIMFVGRDGWLNERELLVSRAEAAGVPRDRVVFTGFVSDREKVGLLYNSAFCIYPSFFEGFGLPILEAFVLGKLIVCSKTSSMSEVAPAACVFFDPTSIIDFARAVSLTEKRAPQLRVALSLTEIQAKLDQHGWLQCYSAIKAWVQA